MKNLRERESLVEKDFRSLRILELRMRFEIGKSYLWLFLTFMGVFVVLAFAPFGQSLSVSVCLLPLFMGFILYSQVRSKVP